MRASYLAVLLTSAAAALGLSSPSVDVERVRSDAACDLVYCGLVTDVAQPAEPLTVGPPPDQTIVKATAPPPVPPPRAPAPVVSTRLAPPVICSGRNCRPQRVRRFRH
jgi:hypothetical protein